jgi:Putative restriction endonuclease
LAEVKLGFVVDSRVWNIRHKSAPRPLRFPAEVQVPETKRHLKLRTLLFAIAERELASQASIGSDQFVYYDAADPRKCLAPDLFVRLACPDTPFPIWKTWEHGAPELCVEIVSDSDAPDITWEHKLARYHALGASEIVRFDPDAAPSEQLRVWDRVEGDLIERVVEGAATPCRTLGHFWVVVPALGFPAALRLSRDPEGQHLLPTAEEGEAAAREAEAAAREAEAAARASAEQELARARDEVARLRRELASRPK